MSVLTSGLKPRNFTWVIKDRLAISERIGGHGFEHRRVRREEEIIWLVEKAGINTIISLLPSRENLAAYEAHGLTTYQVPVTHLLDHAKALEIYKKLREILADSKAKVLVHKDIIDDRIAGMLGGFLVYSAKVTDPILVTALIQEILKRPLGRIGRSLLTPLKE